MFTVPETKQIISERAETMSMDYDSTKYWYKQTILEYNPFNSLRPSDAYICQ